MTQDNKPENNDQRAKARTAYVAPKLTEYGNVREFTRGFGSKAPEKEGQLDN